MTNLEIPRFSVKLVREDSSPYNEAGAFNDSGSAVKLFRELVGDLPHEEFWVMFVDTKSRPIGLTMISRGTINQSLVRPAEVFRTGILLNAFGLVAFHNHPSGNPEPSRPDDAITKVLVEAGKLIGIKVLDHVIIGDTGHYSYESAGKIW